MNKTRLAEKRNSDILKKIKKKLGKILKRLKNRIIKFEKLKKKVLKSVIFYYKKQERQQNYKRKSKMSFIERASIRKQNEPNNEIKQKERIQKRETLPEDIDLARFFELATTTKIYVNSLNLHEIKMKFY